MLKQKVLDHSGLVRALVGAVCLTAAGLFTFNGYSAVQRIDAASFERDKSALQNGLFVLGEIGASELMSLTDWDDTVINAVNTPDPAWLEEYMGASALEDQDERYYLVAPDNSITFLSHGGVTRQPLGGQGLQDAAPVIERARARYAKALVQGEDGTKLDLTRIERDGSLLESVYAHDIAAVGGEPALLIASVIMPDLDDSLYAGTPAVLVNLRRINAVVLPKLASIAQLNGVTIHPLASDAPPGAMTLHDRAGKPVALAAWTAEPPGSAVATAMLPGLGFSLLLFVVAGAVTSRVLTRLTQVMAEREAVAVHAATHDHATGLANRGAFQTGLAAACSSLPEASLCAVVLVDLDYFKSVNDTHGHAAGDAVILAAAERMKAMGQIRVKARLGGDEFALVTGPLPDAAALDSLCAGLHAALCKPVAHDGLSIPLSCSIGACLITSREQDRSASVRHADTALYRAKRDGRGCFRIYDPLLDGLEAAITGLKDAAARGKEKSAAAKVA